MNTKDKPVRGATLNPIAAKLLRKMKRVANSRVVDLRSFVAGRANAEELQKTVVSKEQLAQFHPVHAAYVYAQNQVSVMSEQLTALKEMAPFVAIISKAEDLYCPSAPPMSPLTASYFTCWAFFDACAGPANETIGTITLEVGTLRDARRPVAPDPVDARFANGLLYSRGPSRKLGHSQRRCNRQCVACDKSRWLPRDKG